MNRKQDYENHAYVESHSIRQKRFEVNQIRMGSKLQIRKNNSEFK
jgi:hypothetical protein